MKAIFTSIGVPVSVDNTERGKVRLLNSNGGIIIEQMRYAFSTDQKTIEETMTGANMGLPNKCEHAAEGNVKQLKVLSLCAAAINVASAMENQQFNGAKCIEMVPELIGFINQQYREHREFCTLCPRGLCQEGVKYERILETLKEESDYKL